MNNKWRIVKIILMILFFPFTLTYYIAKSQMSAKVKTIVIIAMWIFFFIIAATNKKEESIDVTDNNPLLENTVEDAIEDNNESEVVETPEIESNDNGIKPDASSDEKISKENDTKEISSNNIETEDIMSVEEIYPPNERINNFINQYNSFVDEEHQIKRENVGWHANSSSYNCQAYSREIWMNIFVNDAGQSVQFSATTGSKDSIIMALTGMIKVMYPDATDEDISQITNTIMDNHTIYYCDDIKINGLKARGKTPVHNKKYELDANIDNYDMKIK